MKKDIIKNAIDLHVHTGPDIMPRKYDLQSLIKAEEGKIGGFVTKRHFLPTSGNSKIETELKIYDSVTLNNSVGGFNADAVRACAQISKKPLFVFGPTVHAEKFLRHQEYEIPPEWFGESTEFVPRKASLVQGLVIWDENKKIKKEVLEVLEAIKEFNCILATGHITPEEAEALVREALNLGIEKIILTHPVCPGMEMPISIQRELSVLGAYVEHCYTMYSIHKIPIKKIVAQIKEVGAMRCIVSSDVGQVFSASPSESLSLFYDLLIAEGITEAEMETMIVKNPIKILRVD